jgi:hypothetical protein
MRSKINLESEKKVPVHICKKKKQIRESGNMNVKLCPLQRDLEVNPRDVLQSSLLGDFHLTVQRSTLLTKLHRDFSLTL